MKKKILTTFVSVLMLLALTVSLAACGGVAGTYKLEEISVTYKGEVYTAKAGEELVFVDKIGETTSTMSTKIEAKDCTLKLKSDGTYSLTLALPVFSGTSLKTETTNGEGKWEEKDGKINILDDNGEVAFTYTVDGKRIVWEIEGFYKLVLKK